MTSCFYSLSLLCDRALWETPVSEEHLEKRESQYVLQLKSYHVSTNQIIQAAKGKKFIFCIIFTLYRVLKGQKGELVE